jgi:hypothetical protein
VASPRTTRIQGRRSPTSVKLYREALLADAQRRIDRHVRSPCGERRLTTTSLPGRSAREGTSSAGPTMLLYTTWTRSPRRRPAFARASRLAWLFATMLPASRSGRAGSHCTSGSHPPRPRVRGRSRVRSPSHAHSRTTTRLQGVSQGGGLFSRGRLTLGSLLRRMVPTGPRH